MELPFLKNRPPRDSYSVGLDIGTSGVKAAKLKFSEGAVELVDFRIEPVSGGLPSAVKKIAEALGIKQVNLSASGTSGLLRYVDFPKMSKAELSGALKFEADKHIPFPINEVNLDSHILKQDVASGKMKVLLAAVKKDFVGQQLKIVKDNTQATVNLFDLDSVAIINAFNFNYSTDSKEASGTPVALLNIGAYVANLNILEHGVPVLSRDLRIAGNDFTQKISDILGVEFSQAEGLKINPQEDKIDKITMAVDSVLANLSAEVRTSFDYYESQGASSVSKVFLSGGGSNFAPLPEKLSGFLGIQAELWDPVIRIKQAPGVRGRLSKGVSGQLAVAIGLALRR